MKRIAVTRCQACNYQHHATRTVRVVTHNGAKTYELCDVAAQELMQIALNEPACTAAFNTPRGA